jgi:hypothetical protein
VPVLCLCLCLCLCLVSIVVLGKVDGYCRWDGQRDRGRVDKAVAVDRGWKLGPGGCDACNVMRCCRHEWDRLVDCSSLRLQ